MAAVCNEQSRNRVITDLMRFGPNVILSEAKDLLKAG
jgi:hypothetical protein